MPNNPFYKKMQIEYYRNITEILNLCNIKKNS